MMTYLAIAFGSAVGGVGRYWLGGLIDTHFSENFPWGTVIVNITGCFVIGIFATLTGPDGRWIAHTTLRQLVMVGVCGGYTTFSSFSLQTLNLVRDGHIAYAGWNIVVSVVFCLLAVWLGHAAAVALNAGR